MSLNNTTADALGQAIASALGVVDAPAIAQWKTICREIYSHLKTDVTTTILPGTIVTAGGPTTQTGPAVPIPINPD